MKYKRIVYSFLIVCFCSIRIKYCCELNVEKDEFVLFFHYIVKTQSVYVVRIYKKVPYIYPLRTISSKFS